MLQDLDLRPVYDAIVVGSGAAGGMAAHVLTSHGMKSLEWPYDRPRRGCWRSCDYLAEQMRKGEI